MHRLISFILCFATVCTDVHANSQSVKTNSSVKSSTLEKMQSRYKNVKTLVIEFNQTQTNVALGDKKESSGRIYLKKPNFFRWETFEPNPSILTANGKKVWFYSAPFRKDEKGQVRVSKAADVQSQLAIDLLAGSNDLKKQFNIKALDDFRLELTPLKPAGDVEHVELELEKKTNLVYKLTLYNITGNQTELKLSSVRMNPELPAAMFNFVAPPNTEEIR